MIRPGEEKDYYRCIELGRNFHNLAYGKKGIPYCEDSCLCTIEMAHSHGLFSVAEVDGVVQGFVIGCKAPIMMNHAFTVGAELVYWVEPEHRSTGSGIGLIKAIESQAKDAGIDIWSMILLADVEPDKVARIYSRMGYEPGEQSYIKRL